MEKEVLQSAPLTRSAGTEGWSHSGAGSMSFSTEKTVSGKGSIKLQFPTFTGKRATGSPSDPDYATYGNSSVTYHLDGANLEKYNRIVFSIYPDCDGARIVNMNLTFRNADTPAKKGYNQPSGSHLINLINKEWNQCFLEIDEYQRDKVMSITFSTALKGKDRTTGDSAIYYLDNLQLQTVKAPEKVSGWIPADGKSPTRHRLCRQPPQNRPHQHKPHHRRRKALPTAYPNRRNSLRRRHPKRENHSRRIWPY